MRVTLVQLACVPTIENENFNTLARHGYNLKHNFGHGTDGLANLLTVLNLLAFSFQSLLDRLCELCRDVRERLGTRCRVFLHGQVLTCYFYFQSWVALFETILRKRRPPPLAPPA